MSPVTHVALMAVKAASIQGIASPLLDAPGSASAIVPTTQIAMKENTRILEGCNTTSVRRLGSSRFDRSGESQ